MLSEREPEERGWRSPLPLLWPLYAGAVSLRGQLYARGWLRVHRLGVPVVSVGNLTVGGTGKSPMVALVARTIARRGIRAAVVSRGYGGRYRKAVVVSDGERPLLDARDCGDEPAMLAAQLPGVPIIIARHRAEGAQLAVSRFAARCVILDDGYQHRSLARDMNLLLLDGEEPFGNGRLLPAGPMREPLAAMARADALIVTRIDRSTAASRQLILRAASRHCPNAPILHARSVPIGLYDATARIVHPMQRLLGARAVCFAGIAHPRRFFDDISAFGAVVVDALPFPDHHRFTGDDMRRVAEAARRTSAEIVVTTEKDLVRIPSSPGAGDPSSLHALRVETILDEGEAFASLLQRAVP